jgi:hypothetical protein
MITKLRGASLQQYAKLLVPWKLLSAVANDRAGSLAWKLFVVVRQ